MLVLPLGITSVSVIRLRRLERRREHVLGGRRDEFGGYIGRTATRSVTPDVGSVEMIGNA